MLITDDGYQRLSDAVIIQACMDYKTALSKKDVKKIREIEAFFLNSELSLYTEINGIYILKCMKEDTDKHVIKHTIKQNKKAVRTSFSAKRKPTKRPVLQYDLSGNLIKEWAKPIDAIRAGYPNTLGRCLLGYAKTAGGFVWRYKKED